MAKGAYIGASNMKVLLECTMLYDLQWDCNPPVVFDMPPPKDDRVTFVWNVDLGGVVYENVLFESDGSAWYGALGTVANVEVYYDGYVAVYFSEELLDTSKPQTLRIYTGTPGGVARKIKKGYVGVVTDIPVYETRTVTETITPDNIDNFFEVTYGSPYTFVGNGSVFTSNNKGVASSAAKITLKPKYDMTISFGYSVSSESKYDTLLVEGSGAHQLSGDGSSGSWDEKSIPAGNSIYFTYSKDGSQDSYDDEAKFYDMVVTCTMTVLVRVETKPVARKIKRGYIGVGGVARPCFGGGEVTAYGAIDSFSPGAYEMVGASTGDYAILACGLKDANSYAATSVHAYNASLTKVSIAQFGVAMSETCGGSVGNYAIFAGRYSSSTFYNTAVVYDNDTLTQQTLSNKLYSKAAGLQSARTSSNVVFSGGYNSTSSSANAVSYATAFNEDLTTKNNSLATKRIRHIGASVGGYALFAGGCQRVTDNGEYLSSVEAFNADMTLTACADIAAEVMWPLGASNEKYALLGAGYTESVSATNTMSAYDADLTRSAAPSLSSNRHRGTTADSENFAVFIGGATTVRGQQAAAGTELATVESYDTALTRKMADNMTEARYAPVAARANEYIVVAGGARRTSNTSSYNPLATSEAYTIL